MRTGRAQTSVALTSLAIATIALAATSALAADYADWMSQNKERIRPLTINQLTLLGSHDSASCDVRAGSAPASGYLTRKDHHISHHASESDLRSAICQDASIRAQLDAGVRHFDLRIAHDKGEYWGMHMWLSTPAFGPGGVFTQVKDFLRDHPDEIVILAAEHLYSDKGPMTPGQAAAFYKRVEKEFGDLLAPTGDFARTTYGDLWSGRARVILIACPECEESVAVEPSQFRSKHRHGHSSKPAAPATPDSGPADILDDPYLWCGLEVDSKWLDEKSQEVLIAGLDGLIARWRAGTSAAKLRRLQAMVTAGHKLADAKVTNPMVLKKLQTDWADAPISVVQVDDAVHSGLMPALIDKLNRQPQP